MNENKYIYKELHIENLPNSRQYMYGNNTNILYVIKQKMKKSPELTNLLNLFAEENNDTERMILIEKILICLTDSQNIKINSRGRYINAQQLHVLETLDKLSLISFSSRNRFHVYSELELADVVNQEFDNLKIEIYAKLMQRVYSENFFTKKPDSEINELTDSIENKNTENFVDNKITG